MARCSLCSYQQTRTQPLSQDGHRQLLPLCRPAAEAPAAADGPVDAYSAAASELATGAALEAKVTQVSSQLSCNA